MSDFQERLSLLISQSGKSRLSDYCNPENKHKGIRNDNLTILADYFNVTTDYLLGRTDVATPDADLRAVCEYTGLSEETIEMVSSLSCKESAMLDMYLIFALSKGYYPKTIFWLYSRLVIQHERFIIQMLADGKTDSETRRDADLTEFRIEQYNRRITQQIIKWFQPTKESADRADYDMLVNNGEYQSRAEKNIEMANSGITDNSDIDMVSISHMRKIIARFRNMQNRKVERDNGKH